MKTKFAKFVTVVAVTLGLATLATAGLYARQLDTMDPAQDGKPAAASIAGKWKMSVETQEGVIISGLALKQDGKTVTGVFSSPHGDVDAVGEFVDRTLTFSATIDAHDDTPLKLTFKAKLQDDGTLAGTLSGAMGDMKWTAERVKADSRG